MSKSKYDYLIIGSGFESFLTALQLQSQGLKGAIVEKSEQIGNSYRGITVSGDDYESHLNYLPAVDEATRGLQELQKWIPNLVARTLDLGPITYQNGQTQPFVGFGQTEDEAVDLYSYFTEARQVELSSRWNEILKQLRYKYEGDILNLSEVTALDHTDADWSVTLNGSQKLTCTHLYFYDNPHRLVKLLTHGTSALPKAAIQKFSKTQLWTSVNLIFQHKFELTQSQAVHILYGAKDQPVVGRFAHEHGRQTSQWLCFVDTLTATDNEFLGTRIREMKKQLKRMYATFPETVEKETIIIQPESYGLVATNLMESGILKKLPNFHLGGHYYTKHLGALGDLTSVLPTEQTTAEPTQRDAEL